ncbi:hypothetical protein [Prosthecobacter dejongeii]|uniref:Uncharacterized protein n=1 Tax=Prosthecobacter dejongeii TaxID=48465 RepID=A0A7W8DP64_9BACT|nr:hypothetical protein [Prosthecobacter dejongeii]MBB5037113.1 hypothetical protein [Prosthecobacter dejongeii]
MKSSSPFLSLWLLLVAFFIALNPMQSATAADVTITAANLTPGANAQYRYGKAGVAITAGQLIYLDVSDNTWKLTDSNSATAAARDVDGLAATTSGTGQPVTIITADDDLTLGGTVVNGTIYVASANPGAIAPAADLTTGWRPIVIAVAKSTTKILFRAEGLRSPTAL